MISRPGRWVASTNRPSAQAIAPQSLTVAVRTVRRVVATTLKLSYSLVAASIIRWKLATSSWDSEASVSGTSKPSEAVKSSSLPIITST